MMRDDERAEQRRRSQTDRIFRPRVKAARQETAEDWPLLSALLGGLALAVLFNTFIGLIPG
ncbi:MAG TPA: hypothetical protein VIU82_21250 [Bosea sp. (in: a-proteobacteria)]